ncbi:DUF6602 domain-containing protein [Duganella vulcania]|uniref:DUF6602 domain-containing protein n=1 Tax=Duganella vulcania TaxID=2692166 RepID=A0A845GPS1_9BURK|nr:DUF6602 domain-containing protein [Duganella vulcania]MYM95266.1 hypothetical protein [Duganella vulcania]
MPNSPKKTTPKASAQVTAAVKPPKPAKPPKAAKSAPKGAKKPPAAGAPIVQRGTLFNDHFSYVEELLLARAKVQQTSGHNLHKGTPREAFIADFLAGHIGEGIGIGTGEVIDARSQSGKIRNQMDVVLYDERIPRFDMGADISLFPIEGVKATIEVKSILQEKDIKQACEAAERISALDPQWPEGQEQPRVPRRFLVAYSSAVTLDTIFEWLVKYYKAAEIVRPDMKRIGLREAVGADHPGVLPHLRSSTLDGIFVFGKGAILFPSFSFALNQQPLAAPRGIHGTQLIQWHMVSGGTGALHLFFLALMESILDNTLLQSYARALRFDRIEFKEMRYTVKI